VKPLFRGILLPMRLLMSKRTILQPLKLHMIGNPMVEEDSVRLGEEEGAKTLQEEGNIIPILDLMEPSFIPRKRWILPYLEN
jgi:hypothetical protein